VAVVFRGLLFARWHDWCRRLLRTLARLELARGGTSAALSALARAFALLAAEQRRADALSAVDAHSTTWSVSEPSVVSARTYADDSESVDGRARATRASVPRSAATSSSVVNGGARVSVSSLAAASAKVCVCAQRARLCDAVCTASQRVRVTQASEANTIRGGEALLPQRGAVDLWLDVADVYCECARLDDADACVNEARAHAPLGADVLAKAARVAELRARIDDAEQLFEHALSLEPTHVNSLRGSGRLLLQRVIADAPHQHALADAAAVHSDAQRFAEFARPAGVFADLDELAPPASETQEKKARVRDVSFARAGDAVTGAHDTAAADDDTDVHEAARAHRDGATPMSSENCARLLLAEHRLRQAVREDPLAQDAWLLLGRVLLATGDSARAADCFFTQLELERSSPVRPFASIQFKL
jgi:tetratricopeptide (TPR) repeat protein